MSKDKRPDLRDDKDDGWTKGIHFDDEAKAKQELRWLKDHSNWREYKLVARIAKEQPLVELLNDDITHLY